jgi:predicted butyrate kinase (DUF1464 family)
MGTADKLCAVALGVHDQAFHLGITYDDTAFIYVELGGAFTSIIAVDGGQIVDGLGGTSGAMGYLSPGAMDGELAYLLGDFHKDVLCSGGMAYVAGEPDASPEDLVDRAQAESDEQCQLAWDAFTESLIRGIAAVMTAAPSPREVLLSGRLSRVPAVRGWLERRLGQFAPVRRVVGFTSVVKEAAQGAALIADGLAGGQHEALVETMRIREAGGTVLDHLYISKAEELRQGLRG